MSKGRQKQNKMSKVDVQYRRHKALVEYERFNEVPLLFDEAPRSEVGVIRIADSLDNKGLPMVWLMNNREKGWAAFGVAYHSINELMRKNRIVITGTGTDKAGHYYEWRVAVPKERKTEQAIAAE